jgi:signal transduction histidine kinase
MRAGAFKAAGAGGQGREVIFPPPQRGSMLRRISTKLILAVLAAVILPFIAFAFFINFQVEKKVARDFVRQSLMGLVQDLAGQIDRFVDERREDAAQWVEEPMVEFALDNYDALPGHQRMDPDRPAWDAATLAHWARTRAIPPEVVTDYNFLIQETRELDSIVSLTGVYDVIMLIGRDGRLATINSHLPDGTLLSEDYLDFVFAYDYSGEDWFNRAMEGEATQHDHHVSPFRAFYDERDASRNYHIGFSVPVVKTDGDEVIGVMHTLVNWSHIQALVATPVIKEYFRGLVSEEQEPSAYAWIWLSDADTIIGHPDPKLYYRSVSNDPEVRLPQLVEAVRANPSGWGEFPEYQFRGEWKNAAFKRTKTVEQGGFHWVVGLGIDNRDIYATSTALRNLLLGGTAIVLLMSILWTMVIARRTTEPIHELQRHARRVAEGHLDETIDVRSQDELGELARDFNRMIRELKEQRDQLVKAEKDAAWREMARQIAHDIKNPLTPIQLSLDLVERARREGNSGYEEILERTLDLIGRQVKNLREIASTFYEFTGGRKPEPQVIELGDLVDDVLRLHDAWAVEQRVEVQREGAGGRVFADPGKLRRVLGNLVSNALQSMPEGGALHVEVAPLDHDRLRVHVRDTGVGLPDEVRAHLFEPYFTTRSEGTGLGLAIARRVIEEMGGTIVLRAARGEEGGRGTVAEVDLPAWRDAPPAGATPP